MRSVEQRHADLAHLEKALVTSRTIGSAIGILMANRNIGQEDALVVLKGVSHRTNVKMRDLAETIVTGADAIKWTPPVRPHHPPQAARGAHPRGRATPNAS